MSELHSPSSEKALAMSALPSSSGMLVLRLANMNTSGQRLTSLLMRASRHVTKTLYVHPHIKPLEDKSRLADNDVKRQLNGHFVRNVYSIASEVCDYLDVRVLMTNLKSRTIDEITTISAAEQLCQNKMDVLLTTESLSDESSKSHDKGNNLPVVVIDDVKESDVIGSSKCNEELTSSAKQTDDKNSWAEYDDVCLGGTFDRLHNGHKILLGEAILLCRKRLTVGVTVSQMIKRKMLYELIEPIDVRIHALHDFLKDVDPSLSYNVVPISDPFGPAVVDFDLQCIVVSEETIRGGQAVNNERQRKGMTPLSIHTIGLLAGDGKAEEQDKLSSTARRMKELGRRRNYQPTNSGLQKHPYLVGLTGGIGSGKSSIARRLAALGAGVVDCDKIAHAAYKTGTLAYNRIIETFGVDVVSTSDGRIDRKALGRKVFGNKEELDKLNAIVWPEVQRLVDAEVARLADQGFSVVIIEAALMIEAGWYHNVHELWVAIIPKEEAVKRVVERDGIDSEQAAQRVDRQLTNEERLTHANAVFCTMWSYEYTQTQVETAWSNLQDYLKTN